MIGTWEKFDDIISQFYDGFNIHNENTDKILNYLNKLDETDRNIFLLFAEFGSYRKVAIQTNRSHTYIGKLIKDIKNEIVDLLNTK